MVKHSYKYKWKNCSKLFSGDPPQFLIIYRINSKYLSVRYFKRKMRPISFTKVWYLVSYFHRLFHPNYISEDIKSQTRFHKKEQLTTIVFVLFYKKNHKTFCCISCEYTTHATKEPNTVRDWQSYACFFRRFFGINTRASFQEWM